MAHCSYCGASTTNPCRTDEEARRCRALKRRVSTGKWILVLLLATLPTLATAQQPIRSYKFTRFFDTECMTADVQKTVIVTEYTDKVTFTSGNAVTTYKIVTYRPALPGEHGTEYRYSCTDADGNSVVVSVHPVITYVMKGDSRDNALVYFTDKVSIGVR